MKVLLVIWIMLTLVGYALQLAFEQLCLRVNEDFLRHPYDCHKFIRCSHQRSYEFQCPANLLWHHEIKTCDFSYRTPCKLNQQNNNMTALKQIVQNKRRKQINLGKKLLKENQNYAATKRDTDLLQNAVKAVTESRLTGIATINTTKQLTSPAVTTVSITNEMVTENTRKTVTETSFSSSLKLNKNKHKNFNNTREAHKSFKINKLISQIATNADKENKAENLSIKKNYTHKVSYTAKINEQPQQQQLNTFTTTEQMLTENFKPSFSLNSTTLEMLTYSGNLTQPQTTYTFMFGKSTKSSLSALSTDLQRENETVTIPLITENFITTEQQLNTVNLTEVAFANNVREISTEFNTFIPENTLNVLQGNNVSTLTAVTRVKEKSKENDNINSILIYANNHTNENYYQKSTTEIAFVKSQTVDLTEINSESSLELTATTTAFNHTTRGFVNSKEIYNKNLLTENSFDVTTENFTPTRETSFDDLTGLTSNNITERRLTDKASTNLTISKSTTSISTSTTLHEYEYLPYDNTTKDPRLPFRSKECQGPNNRQRFKANKCYQYYQCFAGWAFLLNCHDGWMFQIKDRKCILDVRQECNLE